VVSAVAAVWHLLPSRVPSASTRGIGELDLRTSQNAHLFSTCESGDLRSLDSGSLVIRHATVMQLPSRPLVMEPIANLGINLTRMVPVETAEGLAVVEFHPTVCYIQGVQRCGESLTEILANGQTEGSVLRQFVPRIRLPGKGVTETGAVVDVR
jgi:hypothetical protein